MRLNKNQAKYLLDHFYEDGEYFDTRDFISKVDTFEGAIVAVKSKLLKVFKPVQDALNRLVEYQNLEGKNAKSDTNSRSDKD